MPARPKDSDIPDLDPLGHPRTRRRVAGALALAAGIGLCAAALFAEQLGLAQDTAQGTFGSKQLGLLLIGASLVVAGVLLASQESPWTRRWTEAIHRRRQSISRRTQAIHRKRPWTRHVTAAIGSTWFLGAVIALITWMSWGLAPGARLDPSWATALNIAADQRLDFGTDIIFTFGPLGFVNQPQVAYPGPAVFGAVYQVVLALMIAITLLWAARRSFSLPVALIATFVASSLLLREEAAVAIALVWCVVSLGPDPPPAARPMVVFGGAALSAFALLYKLNVGVAVLAMFMIAVVAQEGERRRDISAFLGTFAVALVALWVAAGQGAGNVVSYVSGSVEIIAGFAEAMGTSLLGPGVIEAAIAETLLVIAAAVYVALKLPHRRSIALVAVVLVFGAVEIKTGFVRGDVPHYTRFLGAMLVPWLALQWTGRAERLAALAALAALTVIWFQLAPSRVGDVVQPLSRADAAITDTSTLLDGPRRSQARDAARATLLEFYPPLDATALALLEDQGVHVDPTEVSLAWAYDLDWQPLPVFQRYSAYTPELDFENADALASEDGPPRILRHLVADSTTWSIDGRYGPFEAPAQTLAMLCNYEPLHTTAEYQVLGKASNRCSEERTLETVELGYEEPIAIPRPPGKDQLVIAKVEGLEPSPLAGLLTPLVRSAQRDVVLDEQRFRLVPATAPDGLILSAPAQVDFPGEWAVAPRAETISFSKGQTGSPEGSLEVEFVSLRATPFQPPTGE